MEWDAPATYVNGDPITEPLFYRVWANDEFLKSVATTFYVTDVAAGETCFYLYAVIERGAEKIVSARSETACIDTSTPPPQDGVPNPPTNLRITF